jgi:hypothetical protein
MDGRGRSAWGVALLASALLAGCGDSTGPVTNFDPRETRRQLDDVLAPMDASLDLFLGLELAALTVEAYDGTALAASLRIAPDAIRRSSTLARRAGTSVDATGDGVLTALRDARRVDASAETDMAALVFPSAIQGETLVWDPVDGYVVDLSRAPRPTGSVRIILYEMDLTTLYPAQPLREIGYVDLTDEDGTAYERVGIRAVEPGFQGRELADYYVELSGSGTQSTGSVLIEARGTLGEGSFGLQFDVSQRYDWSQSQDLDEQFLDYRFDAGSSAVTLQTRATARYGGPYWDTLELQATFRGSSSVVTLDADVDEYGAVDGRILRDGRLALRIQGTDAQPRFVRADGRALTVGEETDLEWIWVGLGDLITMTEWIILPVDLLFLPG